VQAWKQSAARNQPLRQAHGAVATLGQHQPMRRPVDAHSMLYTVALNAEIHMVGYITPCFAAAEVNDRMPAVMKDDTTKTIPVDIEQRKECLMSDKDHVHSSNGTNQRANEAVKPDAQPCV
jgi:hypothetical protein